MKPNRATKPSTHQPPTNRAVSAVRSTTSFALVTNGATVAAAMIATVDSAPMFRSRHVANTAYATSAAIAAYRPCTDGTPAKLA